MQSRSSNPLDVIENLTKVRPWPCAVATPGRADPEENPLIDHTAQRRSVVAPTHFALPGARYLADSIGGTTTRSNRPFPAIFAIFTRRIGHPWSR